jgi:RNA polymerase sigma factor (sigma-70 family)
MAAESTAVLLDQLRRLANAKRTEHWSDRELLARFNRQHDAEAFAALVERHGPLVWRICRRTLPREQDAEDAFQAVFLVLMRKAATERWQESIAGWLYAVAVRIALKARRKSVVPDSNPARHAPAATDVLDELTAREALAILDEELARLPENYRTPVALCLVEGRTQEETARQTGWSLSTVRRRLEHGRALLQQRLTRRGLGLSAALGVLLTSPKSNAAVPILLEKTILEAARLTMAGKAATSAVSTTVLALAEGIGTGASVPVAAKVMVGLTLVLSILAAGTVLIAKPTPIGPTAQKPRLPLAAKSSAEEPPPKRTDLQGDPLPEEALVRLGTYRFRDAPHHFVRDIAYDPANNSFVTVGAAGIRVLDAASGQELKWFPSDLTKYLDSAMAVSPDGKLVAKQVWNPDGSQSIGIREAQTDRPLQTFGQWNGISRRLFSQDSKLLAVELGQNANGQQTIEIWDARNGGFRQVLVVPKFDFLSAFLFTIDGKTLITGGIDGIIRLWDIVTATETRRIDAGPNQVYKLAVSPSGALLASLNVTEIREGNRGSFPTDNRIRVWDTASGKEVWQLDVPSKELVFGMPPGFSALAFAPDGKTLVTSGVDEYLRFWDLVSGQVRHKTPQSATAHKLFFMPDGKTLVATCGPSISLLDGTTGRERNAMPGHYAAIAAAGVASNGGLIATIEFASRSAIVWDPESGRIIRQITVPGSNIHALAIAHSSPTLFTHSRDEMLRVWDLTTGRELLSWKVENISEFWKLRIALSNDDKLLAATGKDKSVRLYDAATGGELGQLADHPTAISHFEFNSDCRTLVVMCQDHTCHVWDALSRRKTRHFPLSTEAAVVGEVDNYHHFVTTMSPDGRFMAYFPMAAKPDVSEICLLDFATGNLIRRIECRPFAMSFSPDGKTLACGTWPNTVLLMEVASGKKRHELLGHRGDVYAFAFSRDGRFLVTGSADTTAMVWDLTGRLAAKGKWDKPPTQDERETAWNDLAGSDAARAWKAIQRLEAAPKEAVPFVAKRTPDLVKQEKLDPLRAVRTIELLERIATPEAKEVLVTIAQGAAGSRITEDAKASLARLNRSTATEKPH